MKMGGRKLERVFFSSFLKKSEGTLESFVVPFGRLFGTKLGGVLVWRRGSSFASFRGSGSSSSSWSRRARFFFVSFEKLSPGVGGRAAALRSGDARRMAP